jgi:2-keto-3-deoxy-L-rhamnonate aldolase RhmA
MPFGNKLKQILQRGEVAVGAVTQIPSTAMVEILGYAGFDFVMIDTEHGMFDLQTAGELIRAADGSGLTPLVRVIKNDESLILKALDLGAKGIVVPHITTRSDVEKALKACKYGPGGRGSCPLVRANRYGLDGWASYQDAANENTMFIALVEDMDGVEQIDEILTGGGIDAVLLGAFDMSVGAGLKGDVQHPRIQQAMDKILAACKRHGIPAMHTTTNGPDVQAWVNKGVRLIMQSADSVVFARACSSFLQSVESLRHKAIK